MGVSLSTRDQMMGGFGFPRTSHCSSALEPSRTVMEDWPLGTLIVGGTKSERQEGNHFTLGCQQVRNILQMLLVESHQEPWTPKVSTWHTATPLQTHCPCKLSYRVWSFRRIPAFPTVCPNINGKGQLYWGRLQASIPVCKMLSSSRDSIKEHKGKSLFDPLLNFWSENISSGTAILWPKIEVISAEVSRPFIQVRPKLRLEG